jgi:hypothetical protein
MPLFSNKVLSLIIKIGNNSRILTENLDKKILETKKDIESAAQKVALYYFNFFRYIHLIKAFSFSKTQKRQHTMENYRKREPLLNM